MKIIFIILHYKDSILTIRCLDSVRREIVNGDQVIVIDASHDFERDNSVHESIHIKRTDQYNPGFARAMNFGATEAEAFDSDAFCFVNNDAILEVGFRNKTLRAFEICGRQVAAVGPKIVYLQRPDMIWSAGGYVSRFKMTSIQTRQYMTSSSVSGFIKTKFLSGCVITIDALAFKEIGGWPESYLFGGEEWELSSRFIDMGKTLIVAGDAVVQHEAEFEAGQGKSHSFNDIRFVLNSYINRVLYADRNVSRIRAVIFRVYLALYISFIIPFRWRKVAEANSISKKMRYSVAIAKHVLKRTQNKPVTWSELSEFVASVTTD